ncbi:MAG: hypothetical protein KQ78_01816 [Candidatus Izimaplasma bacterium HR2]|nr:MAG: hypothetical protein KQ78_01816 [Candidatus Izimaplasma bacterium HR2]
MKMILKEKIIKNDIKFIENALEDRYDNKIYLLLDNKLSLLITEVTSYDAYMVLLLNLETNFTEFLEYYESNTDADAANDSLYAFLKEHGVEELKETCEIILKEEN